LIHLADFSPTAVRSSVPKILAVTVGGALLSCALFLAAVAAGDARVAYVFRDGKLAVHTGSFLDGQRRFAAAAVADVRVVQLTGSRRIRGTALEGVCTGRYWHAETGPVWQATDCSSRGLLLTVSGEDLPILVSPPDPRAFVARLAAPADGSIELAPGRVWPLRLLTGTLALMLAAGAALSMTIFLLGARRMRYAVAGGKLTVTTLFRHRSWELARFRARAYSPPQVPTRLIGASMPGYYTGLFSEKGISLRVYATDLASGVLLEGPERLYLSPEDPKGFLAAIAEAAG
jgi:hypothetical protein